MTLRTHHINPFSFFLKKISLLVGGVGPSPFTQAFQTALLGEKCRDE